MATRKIQESKVLQVEKRYWPGKQFEFVRFNEKVGKVWLQRQPHANDLFAPLTMKLHTDQRKAICLMEVCPNLAELLAR